MDLTVTHKDAPKDTEFAIAGLGLFTNGKSREVTEEQADAFEAIQGYPVDKIKTDYIKVGGGKAKPAPADEEDTGGE